MTQHSTVQDSCATLTLLFVDAKSERLCLSMLCRLPVPARKARSDSLHASVASVASTSRKAAHVIITTTAALPFTFGSSGALAKPQTALGNTEYERHA